MHSHMRACTHTHVYTLKLLCGFQTIKLAKLKKKMTVWFVSDL